jgi:O6-methylguanine-DNA--protein-cysteine methyltransferase
VALLVPCHRVVPADGTIGGYGGDEARKEALLRLEGALGGLSAGAP